MSGRVWGILTDGFLTERNAKTAHGVLRYSQAEVAAVIDANHAGRSTLEVIPEVVRDVPVVKTWDEARDLGATSLLLGVATPGGWMPEHWRAWILDALRQGYEVVNGLHSFLSDDPEFVSAANGSGARLWDVRRPPDDIPLFSGKSLEVSQGVALTVGSDCAVGKKSTALEMTAAARAAGVNAEFLATGQTGIMIAGKGIAIDRVISDFAAGAAEQVVLSAEPDSEVLIVEGQGSLWHPAYAGVTLSLLHGSAPHALILCHQVGRSAIEEPPYTELPDLSEMIEVYERMASTVRAARVACVSLNCQGLAAGEARDSVKAVEEATGLPAGDVFAGDAPKLWNALAANLSAQ
ncbi:MAG: DUF1611 domain-containing protein [Actinobacteria bacterium]|nr:DUF1611 domain-containing protein [Actinomycetota bacterium]